MREIIKKVYKFEELPDNIKEKAVENLYDLNVDYDWWNSVYDDAEQIGLKLEGFDIDRGSYCEGKFTISADEVAQNIFNKHGEKCETYKTAKKFMEEWQPIFNDYMDENSENYESIDCEDKLMKLEDEFLKSLLEDYLVILRHEYEYLTSEEAIIETINAIDYEFDENGNIA